jgi:hypothetical protein
MIVLRGAVERGRGHVSQWYARDAVANKALRAHLPESAKLHRGTLNVLVPVASSDLLGAEVARTPWPYFVRAELGVDWIRHFGRLPFRACTLNGGPAFILRTYWPATRLDGAEFCEDHALVQFEIVAAWIDGMTTGTTVTLAFDETAPVRFEAVPP